MQHINKSRFNLRGFTVVEVMVIAPVLMLVIGVFVGVITELVSQSVVSRAQSQAVYDVQDALSRIEQDVKTSSGFLSTNSMSSTILSPQGLNDDTTAYTGGSSVLILKMTATTTNPNDSAVKPVYSNTPNTCTNVNVIYNTPMIYNVVYFVKNGSLWRRTMMPSGYNNSPSVVWCNTAYQQPSCTVGVVNANCLTEDIEILQNMDTSTTPFALNYYTNANNFTPTAITSGNASTLNTVQVNLITKSTIAGKDIKKSGSLRVSNIGYSAF